MAITFACPCGKLLKARAEFAGRRTRCTRCHMVLIVPHVDQNVGTVSETELLAPGDFGDVDNVIRPGVLAVNESMPLEAFARREPVTEAPPPAPERDAQPVAWQPPVESPFPFSAVAPSPAVTPRRRSLNEPWVHIFLIVNAYACILFGMVQLVIVAAAVALRPQSVSPWMLLASFGGLLGAEILGGLILLAVDVVRGARRPPPKNDG